MSTPFNAALAAYGNAQRLVSDAAGKAPAATAGAGTGPDFGKLLAESLQQVSDAGKASDTQAMQMVQGKADPVDVVTAISQTEVAIQGMVAVRDRVIAAYEEIMRMPI